MSAASVAMKTVFKMFDIPPEGRISREHFERYAAEERAAVMKLNPAEAEKVYKSLMAISDALGLEKNAKDGGMSYTIREMEIAHHIAARGELRDANRSLATALFNAIDKSGDGVLQRNEWSNYLKIRKSYISEGQARKSFDSIDKNKNGVISLPEYVARHVDFWCDLGEDLGSQDLFGTKDL